MTDKIKSQSTVKRMRYTRQTIVTSTYLQMPHFLMTGEFSGSNLSNNARVLYTLLLNRHRVSVENKWFDDNGEVFMYFTREEMGELIGLSKGTIIKVMQELTRVMLVEEKKQGFNKPNKIYLLSPVVGNDDNYDQYILIEEPEYNLEEVYTTGDIESIPPEVQELNPVTYKKYTSGGAKIVPTEVQELNPNKNNYSKNNINKNNLNTTATTATAGNSEPSVAEAADNITEKIPYSKIIQMYNRLCESTGHRSIRSISGKRKIQTAARYKEYGIDGYIELFEKVSKSHFLCGGGDRGWKADYDWLIAPTNMQKVLEGKYDNDQLNVPRVSQDSQHTNNEWYDPFLERAVIAYATANTKQTARVGTDQH